MAADERYCGKCGTKARIGASFCAKCGAWVGEEMPDPLPVAARPAAPPPERAEVITREYANWPARDLDINNMRAHGFAAVGQEQMPAGRWRVLYRHTAAPGMVGPPPQTIPRKGMNPWLLVAICLGVIAVFGLGNAALSSSGGGTGGSTSGGTAPTLPSTSAARVVDPRLLASNPSSYKGSNIIVQGEALNVEQHSDYTWVQVMARIPGKEYDTEPIVVELRPVASALLKGECYSFYGIGAGTQKVTRTLTGATNDVPVLRGYNFYTSAADKYGTCGAPAP